MEGSTLPEREDTATRKTSRDEPEGGQRIVVFWEGGSISRDLRDGDRLTVGRAEGCDLRVPDDSVSRRHVVVHGGRPPHIEDLASANGTYLADVRLMPYELRPLTPATVVELGDALLALRAEASREPSRDYPSVSVPALGAIDPPMARVLELVDIVATTTLPVLLLGETGVGKSLVAEKIHRRSPRSSKPFIRLNCAALPDGLLESELFGHERGAFTGALQTKPGLLEEASGGTLLLDEIGDMPLPTQAKLLHVLEHQEVTRVGALKPRAIDVRFIAATHSDLSQRVEEGTFRQDLYFRLNGVVLEIPPLRERPREIRSLALAFAGEASSQIGRVPIELGEDVLELLAGHSWPGNVRELRHAVVRACLFARRGRVGIEQFELASRVARGAPASRRALWDDVRGLEKQRIVEALDKSGGNQVRAAKALHISRGTLRDRMRDLGLLAQRPPRR